MIKQIIKDKINIHNMNILKLINKVEKNHNDIINLKNRLYYQPIPSFLQDKEWRKQQKWYFGGKKNECEIYQREQIKLITGMECLKTDLRFNIFELLITKLKHPLKFLDGLEYTENFDGIFVKDNIKYLFNFKFICDFGGAQTRSLREVYYFVFYQLEYLLKNINSNIIFVNILDGNTCYEYQKYFKYLINKKEYKIIKNKVFVGDMYQFTFFYS